MTTAHDQRLGMCNLLAERFTEQVQDLWPVLTLKERDYVLRQTTVEGMEIALADLRKAHP